MIGIYEVTIGSTAAVRRGLEGTLIFDYYYAANPVAVGLA